MNQFGSLIRAFVVALLATVLMALVRRFVFIPFFEFKPQALPIILAIMLAASIGGLKAGLLATLLNAGLLTFFDGETGFHLVTMPSILRLVMIVVVGGLISWGIESLYVARKRLEDRQRELEGEVRRREETEILLREREERIRLAVEAANIGTWDFNLLTGEQTLSSRAKAMLGLSTDADCSNVSFRDRVHPEDRERVNQAIQRAYDPSGNGTYEVDCRLVWPDNTVHWFIAKGQAVFEGEKVNRRATRLIGTAIDITDRKLAEEALRQAEGKFRKLATHAPVGIFHTDDQGRGLFVNDAWCAIAGARPEDALGDGYARFIHPEDRQRVVEEWQLAALNRRDYISEFRFLNHEKGSRWVLVSATAMYDPTGAVSGYVGTVVDLTDRKKVSDALEEEREMLRHTIEVQDQERQLIAYEIHDGLVQYATGALMRLESLRDQVQPEPLAEQIENITSIVRKTVNEGRRIINGIHTTILDDCGVVAAVQQLIEDEERAHVEVEFIKDETLGRMAPNIELALYHITQEALTNAHKHSKSDKVRVELTRHEDRVHLEVRDWGIGLSSPTRAKGIHGLRAMTERARIAGGQCTIRNARGKGTQVVVDLPYVSKT